MITSLSINNYALINKLHIEPVNGLNIITGETGAGKSIMLGAVGLLLGKRADIKSLLNKDKKCIIEAEFDITKLGLKSLFDKEDLDYEEVTIIRREINPKGKSRSFINDVPVTLDVLKEVGLKLVDIHSQNESIQLGKKEVKVKIIDDYSQSKKLLHEYQDSYNHYKDTQHKLESLLSQDSSLKADADYKKYQLDELTQAELQEGEQVSLENELNLLEHAEEIKLKLSEVEGVYEASEVSINDQLKSTINSLRSISNFSEEVLKLTQRFEGAVAEIEDVVADLKHVESQIEYDQSRLELVQQRLDLIYRLQQKHQVLDVRSLLDIQNQMELEASKVIDLDVAISDMKLELKGIEKKMIDNAERLSGHRRGVIDGFCDSLNKLLGEVGMPNGHVAFAYKRVDAWKMGIDELEFLFSANKGVAPEPVGNVASGGEFSRLMFCVKYLLAQKTAMPTVIFDEIDTGVSGEIAIKLAIMMRKMAKKHQLIAISHLPQVAAKGDQHYFVYKDSNAEKTESLIRSLGAEEKLQEIAKMIGGDNPSDIAINSARELIEKK